jgi:hypothetical protein
LIDKLGNQILLERVCYAYFAQKMVPGSGKVRGVLTNLVRLSVAKSRSEKDGGLLRQASSPFFSPKISSRG